MGSGYRAGRHPIQPAPSIPVRITGLGCLDRHVAPAHDRIDCHEVGRDLLARVMVVAMTAASWRCLSFSAMERHRVRTETGRPTRRAGTNGPVSFRKRPSPVPLRIEATGTAVQGR